MSNRSAYFVKRLFAFGFDWYLSSVLLNLVVQVALPLFNLPSEPAPTSDLRYRGLVSVSALLTSFLYYVWIPLRSASCATPLQRAVQLEIQRMDGTRPNGKQLLFRFFVGCFLLQGIAYGGYNAIAQVWFGQWRTNLHLIDALLFFPSMSLLLLSSFLALRDKAHAQALHDRLAHTRVVEK